MSIFFFCAYLVDLAFPSKSALRGIRFLFLGCLIFFDGITDTRFFDGSSGTEIYDA